MKNLAAKLARTSPWLLASAIFCAFPVAADASVTFEFQLGEVPIPGNSLGVIVVDTAGDGFASPQEAVGTVLSPGNAIGAGDDRIISVFPITKADPFSNQGGFAEFIGPIDYDALGLGEGQSMIFYALPGHQPGSVIRPGETIVSFRTDQGSAIAGNMNFSLPPDGGTYSLGVLDTSLGGQTDFNGLLPETPLLAVEDPSDLIVGKDFELQLEGTGDPTLYIVRGLPPGLRYDRQTGLITGRLVRPGSFEYRVWIRNSAGTSGPLTVAMEVAALPDEAIGNFQGLVARDETLNEALGGKLVLRTASNGRLTGRIFLGRRSYGFRGALEPDIVSGEPTNPTASITVNRGRMTPLSLDLEFDLASEMFQGSVGDQADSSTVDGFHNSWHPRFNRPEAFEGYYTAWLDLDPLQGLEGDLTVPQGNGFASARVVSNGLTRWVGKMADGSTMASAGFLGPEGEYCVYRTLYGNTGSVIGSGAIQPDPNHDDDFSDNVVDGLWDWLKHPQANPRQRNYRDGFGTVEPVNQLVAGERYLPPARGEILLGLPEAENNAQLIFSEGGVANAELNPDLVFTATAGARGIVPRPGTPENPTRTVFSVNRRNGLFRGGFLLQDTDPDSDRPIRRRAAYLGMLRPSQDMGAGYFLLGQLPDTEADPPENLRTAPILSGQVIVEGVEE
ncbi:MAG: hypothetical protein KDN19_16755 [Verrucomicrobiae bacterium]|nr:hypothetical protein [Verrucomicrobiae bacterium]